MGFGQAVSTCFQKYVDFSGRARRSEFWWWVLFTILVSVVASLADALLHLQITANGTSATVGWIGLVAGLFLLLPGLAVTFRRLHDTGRSGWWWLLSLLCCIGAILLWIFCLSDSAPGTNQYGPNPQGA
ncbi:MAG TPA: DUF805 domain-containing protein [Candidatus Nanopelagicales bacterium]|nr:DUF805 domain-containing protein [Candidatus Nanopelagicales bacterium]